MPRADSADSAGAFNSDQPSDELVVAVANSSAPYRSPKLANLNMGLDGIIAIKVHRRLGVSRRRLVSIAELRIPGRAPRWQRFSFHNDLFLENEALISPPPLPPIHRRGHHAQKPRLFDG